MIFTFTCGTKISAISPIAAAIAYSYTQQLLKGLPLTSIIFKEDSPPPDKPTYFVFSPKQTLLSSKDKQF